MPVFPWMKKEGEENKLEISLPDADKKKIDDAVAAAAELPAIKEKLSSSTLSKPSVKLIKRSKHSSNNNSRTSKQMRSSSH